MPNVNLTNVEKAVIEAMREFLDTPNRPLIRRFPTNDGTGTFKIIIVRDETVPQGFVMRLWRRT